MKYVSVITIIPGSRNLCQQNFVTWPILCSAPMFRPEGRGDRMQWQSKLMQAFTILSKLVKILM
jgi:hypothetical protein